MSCQTELLSDLTFYELVLAYILSLGLSFRGSFCSWSVVEIAVSFGPCAGFGPFPLNVEYREL
jgi:hypothetical protein